MSTFFRSDKACHLFHLFPRKCVTYVVFRNSQNVSKGSESQKIVFVKKKKDSPPPFWRVTVSLHCISILHHTGRTSIYKMITDLDCYSMIYGEGNGTPLQHSCLENLMDGGAWWATVHGVAKSRTRLSNFTFTFHFHALEKEMATHSSVLAWRIPGTGEPCGLLSMGSHRVGHD